MAVHSFQLTQLIPVSREKAWEFFSDHTNLIAITPPEMKFRPIAKFAGNKLYAGQIIDYKVSPLLGIPLYWMTEITHVQPGEYFVDEQRKGPYGLWHHQHHFRSIEGGTEMKDIVHYSIPLGFLGNMINGLMVKKKLKDLFDYRYRRIEEIFGKWQGA